MEKRLEAMLKAFPVCVLTGARQTGKSTLVRSFSGAGRRTYLSLDEMDILEQARLSPDSLLRSPDALTLDEVQRSPNLLLAVKRAVDKDRRAGRFILTGSANLLLMQRISETLAGRAVYLSLWPLTQNELGGEPRAGNWGAFFSEEPSDWPDIVAATQASAKDWTVCARRGGYPTPALALADERDRAAWYTGYVQTYLERDIQDIASVSSLVDFRRLMRATCLRIGTILNQTELARDIGLSQPTAHRYLNALEASYQLVRLPAYAVNRTKRLIKSPKVYWVDTALAMHIAGETEHRGAHFENLILSDLLAWRGSHLDEPSILYWRSTTGEEVDFVIEWKNKLLPIEVKSTAKPRTEDARHITVFRKEYRSLPGLLLHAGKEVRWISDDVLAIPWWKVVKGANDHARQY